MASSQDAWYLSLLGLAEHFRSSSPPNIKACIQCLQAVFNFKPPPRVEARTHLQLGNILLVHTRNVDLARTHLEKAWELSQAIQSFDDVKFESASVLAQLFEQQQQQKWAKERLRRAVEMSQGSCYWHCRLLFQLAQLHATEKDYVSACSLLGVGVEFTRISGANYTQILFLLSKTMLLLAERKLSEASPLLVQGGSLVEAWQGTVQQKEYLKVFFLVLQTCYYLLAGQVKCSKSWLKQLQQSVQEISQWPDEDQVPACSGAGDMFMWMPKEELCVVVYLVTVMHSMQAGYMDKAQKYSEKALSQIERLSVSEERPILRTFHLMILEHVVQCRLVMGDNTNAIQEVSNICALCSRRPTLLSGHRAQVHTILGLYAMSMGCMDAAEAQLNAALRTSQERELWTFVNMNLAIVYLRTGRQSDFLALLDRVSPEALPSQSHCLRAASYYIQGLHGFFQHHYNDAKRYLRETLKMANSEDLNRLTSCSLVLLGNIFLSLGNNRDSFNMVTPAMQLASKIPDVNVQMWASAVLKDLYRACGDHGKESAELQKRTGFAQALLLDRNTALQSPHHGLLRWTDGPVPSSAAVSSSSTETSHPQAAAASSSVAPAAAAASVQSSPAPLSRTTPLPATVSPAAATAAVGVPNQQPCQQRVQMAQRQHSPHPAAAHISPSAHAAAAHISPSAHAAAHVSPSAHAAAHISPSAHAAAHISPSAHAAAHISPSAHTVSARLALQQQDQAAQLAAAAAGYHQAAGGGGYSASGVMSQQEAMVGYGGMMAAAQTHAHQPVSRQVAAMGGGVMQTQSQQGFHHSHHMMTPQQAHQLAGMYAPSMMAAAAAAAAAHQSSYHHQPPP